MLGKPFVNSPTPKQLAGIVVLLLASLVAANFFKDGLMVILGLAVVGAGAVLLTGGGGAPAASLGNLGEAVRKAANGERTSAPAGASEEVLLIYDELARIGDRRKKELAEVEARRAEAANSESALEEASGRLVE